LRDIWILPFHLRLGLRAVCFLHYYFQSTLCIYLLSRAYYKHNALFPPWFDQTKLQNYVIPLYAIFSIQPFLASYAKALPDLQRPLFNSCRYFESWCICNYLQYSVSFKSVVVPFILAC
jgi:hypothetical protein